MSKFSNFHTRDLHNEAFIASSDDEDGLSFEEYENFRISLQVLMVLRLKKIMDNKEREKREKFLLKKNMNYKQQNTTQMEGETFAASESKVQDSSSSKRLSLVGIPKSSIHPNFRHLSDISTETPKSSRTKCSTAVPLATRSLRPDKLSAEIPVELSQKILNKSSIKCKHKSETDLAKPQTSKLALSQKPIEMKHSKTSPSLNNLSKLNKGSKINRIHMKKRNTECKNQLQGREKNSRLDSKLAFSTPESNLESSRCEDNVSEVSSVLKFGFNVASSEPTKKTLQEKNLSKFSISIPERKTKMAFRRKSILRDENSEYTKKCLWKNEKDQTDNKPIFSTPNDSNFNSKSKLDSYRKSDSACASEFASNLKSNMNIKPPETNKTLQNENSMKLEISSLDKKADEYFRLKKMLKDKGERCKDKTEHMNELSGGNEDSKINTMLVFSAPKTKLESADSVNMSDTPNSSNSSPEPPKISNITLHSKDISNVNASYFYCGTKISFEEKKFLEHPIFDKIATSSRKANYNEAEIRKAMALKQKSADAACDTLHSLLLSSLQISTPRPKADSSRSQIFSRKSI